ncbi:hypothetical protein Tco_1306992 [Tanacetum coccineum]
MVKSTSPLSMDRHHLGITASNMPGISLTWWRVSPKKMKMYLGGGRKGSSGEEGSTLIGKVIATNEIIDGYVMPKYGNKNLFEDDSWIDFIIDDVHDTFYRDEEEEAKVAKASEDMKLSIMKAMVESEKAIVKDYTKLVVTDGMVDYVLEKYGNTWKCEDEIFSVILEDLWLKYGKYDNGKGAKHHHLKGKGKVHDIQNRLGSLEVDLARAIKAKQVDDHDDDDLDSLDLANRIKKLKEDFGRLLKAKEAKKVKEAKKARETKKANEAKKAREAKKAKEEILVEVVQISSDEDDDEDPTAPTSTRSKAPTASTSTRSKASTTYTSTRSRAPIASTSNAQAAFTAPRGYRKIAMT